MIGPWRQRHAFEGSAADLWGISIQQGRASGRFLCWHCGTVSSSFKAFTTLGCAQNVENPHQSPIVRIRRKAGLKRLAVFSSGDRTCNNKAGLKKLAIFSSGDRTCNKMARKRENLVILTISRQGMAIRKHLSSKDSRTCTRGIMVMSLR